MDFSLSRALQRCFEVIEAVGLGFPQALGFFPSRHWSQVLATCLCGFIWAADGAELLLLGAVTNAVASEWALEAWQRGVIVSVVFVGILLGNTVGGPPHGSIDGSRWHLEAQKRGVYMHFLVGIGHVRCQVRVWRPFKPLTTNVDRSEARRQHLECTRMTS